MFERIFFNNNEKITKRVWVYFVIIVLANIFFRIIDLDFSSFWYDEIIAVKSASEDFGHIKHVSEWDNNPPFYYYCLSVWIKLLNNSEFCSRLLSVLFVSFSGGIVFLFANKYFNKVTAIVTSFLFLSSNVLFFYSHEARAYALVLLLALLSSYLYFSLKERPVIKTMILLGLINFLLIYTHYISGLVIAFETILMFFCFEKKQKKYFFYSTLISILFTAIRFTKKQILLILAFNGSGKTFWLKKADIHSLYTVLTSFFFNKTLVIPLILLIFIGIALLLKFKTKDSFFAVLYSFLVGIGSVVVLFIMGTQTPIFLDRYLIFSIPFILLLIAYALSFIKIKMIPIVLSVAFFMFSAFKIDYKTDKGMNYRSTVSFLKYFKKEGDLVIVKTKDVKSLFCYYYDKDFLAQKKSDLPETDNIIFCTSWADMDKDPVKYKRIIVIDSFSEMNPDEPEFVTKLSALKHKYAILDLYRGVKITLYK
ncbi:MAG: glycosyltransferase family 39 protein [Bacteroidetes bacterium]|nr:glycosyltransferase family 39 protein [Bacteroidota bacterium]